MADTLSGAGVVNVADEVAGLLTCGRGFADPGEYVLVDLDVGRVGEREPGGDGFDVHGCVAGVAPVVVDVEPVLAPGGPTGQRRAASVVINSMRRGGSSYKMAWRCIRAATPAAISGRPGSFPA